MSLNSFIHFNGNCREALAFYSKVFGVEASQVMTYGEIPKAPEGSECSECCSGKITEESKKLICYSSLPIGGSDLLLSDALPGTPLVAGNNITISFSSCDPEELRRLFGSLKEGGSVCVELRKTFWTELFGMVVDKFGINWMLSKCGEECECEDEKEGVC